MYDEWLTDRSWEAIELNKFSCVRSSAKNRPAAIGIYSLNGQRGVDVALAQHAGQSHIVVQTCVHNLRSARNITDVKSRSLRLRMSVYSHFDCLVHALLLFGAFKLGAPVDNTHSNVRDFSVKLLRFIACKVQLRGEL